MAATVAAAGWVAPSPASATTAGECSAVTLFTHRGDQTAGDEENSLAALRRATDLTGAFETDLRTTADGRIVLMHDATIDRTTTGTGAVAQMTGPQLVANPLKDGSTVPYLSTVLNMLVRRPAATAMLELKPDAMTPASLHSVARMITGRHLRPRVIVYSYSRAEVSGIRAVVPTMRTSLISDGNESTWSPRRFLPYGGANVYAGQRSSTWIAEAHALGLRLIGRDAEDATRWGQAVDAGVVGQILDGVASYRDWCGSLAP